MAEARVSTGNPNLDEILQGGLVAHRPYLIVGPCGTGKTKLALQFLCEGARRGERVLLVTLEDPPNEMRINHRAMQPELDKISVFDAIPDVMRYERAPFKDIAAVRSSVQFSQVAPEIRKTAELVSVEVTFSALEQTLKMEMARQNYSRLVVDSLTALQYFCMKGIDETQGAQSFLRFLSDLRATALLTVEAPVEEVESAERLLARGEIRLFRWELDGRTVRAIGVEKFRGSAHDNRLHPYRISPSGLDIDLKTTISRDTRRVVDSSDIAEAEQGTLPITNRPLELNLLLSDIRDLAALGVDVAPAEAEIESGRAAAKSGKPDEVALHFIRARAVISELAQHWNPRTAPSMGPAQTTAADRVARIAFEGADLRASGAPPRLLESWGAESLGTQLSPPEAAPPIPSENAMPTPVTVGAGPPDPTSSRPTNSGPVDLSHEVALPPAPPPPTPPPPPPPPPIGSVVASPGGDREDIPAPPPPPFPPPPPPSSTMASNTLRTQSRPSDPPIQEVGPRPRAQLSAAGISKPPLPSPTGQSPEPPMPLTRPESGATTDGARATAGVRPADVRPSAASRRAATRPPLPDISRRIKGEPVPVGELSSASAPAPPAQPAQGTPPASDRPTPPRKDTRARGERTPKREKIHPPAVTPPPETTVVEPTTAPSSEAATSLAEPGGFGPMAEPVPAPRELAPATRPRRSGGPRRSAKSSAVVDGTAKPRRRTASRRAAPPVTGAAAGTPPPELAASGGSSQPPPSEGPTQSATSTEGTSAEQPPEAAPPSSSKGTEAS